MATADLKLIYGSGGGDLNPSFFSGPLQIASGSTGTLLTLTAPAGKLVRLTGLACDASDEANISIVRDGVTVVTALTLATASGTSVVGEFVVGSGMSSTPTSAGSGCAILPFVQGSVIVISKSGGSTASIINYSYVYGD